MSTKLNLSLRVQVPTAVTLVTIVGVALWYFIYGAAMPVLDVASGTALVAVGFLAGVLGGLIGTGGCSVMLPVIHFWMGYPVSMAIGTTLFAVIFTAISGGYGHLVRRNLDIRAVAWLGGAGILGVLLGSWLFTLLTAHVKLLGLILGLVFLWPAIRMVSEGIRQRGMPQREGGTIPGPVWGWTLFGFVVGIVTGVAGLGGGYALVPGLIYLFGAPVYVTMGTSLAAMIPLAVVGGGIKLAQGFVSIVTTQTVDPAAEILLQEAEALGVSTAFSRAAAMAPCPIGEDGRCCKNCHMGPCRLVKPGQRGVCGATLETVAARNLARAIAAGAAAHSDHGLDMAFTLEAVARGEAPGYEVRDPHKLRSVARLMGIQADARPVNDLALEVAERAIENFRQMRGELTYVSRAPAKRQEIWRGLGIAPRSVTREIVETLHRTHIGTDQDPEHILRHALRTALSDGWGGSMLATDISDILFGTPSPTVAQVNLGVLKSDEVNIVIHGHEPTLSEMIVAAAQSPELVDHARSKGAAGINLCGICCTANEILMRQGVSVAGNFLSQELALLTGAVEAMVVDVQCIMQALGDLSSRFHTRLITTSPKADITGATHIEFDEHRAPEIAREIVRLAGDNFPNRNGRVTIPPVTNDLVPGFSHEYINYMQGGSYRGSFRPLNDAVVTGRVRGAAGVVGCNNPRTTHDETHIYLVREFLKNDVLVVMTGCGAIPPALHLGSCVDNSRILTVLTEMATEGGLGQDIADLPVVGFAPEWMSEKALSIGTYFVASGVYTIFGVGSPVGGSEEVTRLIGEGWEKQVGARLEFEPDPQQMLAKALAHIDASRFGASGDRRMREVMALPLEERAAALYGREQV